MEPMTFWHSPAWVAVFANGLFALVTVGVIVWQVRVSARNGRIQNRLIRLQHEHEWTLQKNQERLEILKTAQGLHLAAGCLKEKPSDADPLHWAKVIDAANELNSKLTVLDVAVFTGSYDDWYPALTSYVDAVRKAWIADSDLSRTYDVSMDSPTPSTRKALKDAEKLYKPMDIFASLKASVRLEFLDFKRKWDNLLP